MRRAVACGAVAGLFLINLFGPLFHIHFGDAHEAALVHAHFPDADDHAAENTIHVESSHSHSNAQSIDMLTTVAPQIVQFDAIVLTAQVILKPVQECCGYASLTVPHSHAPPGLEAQVPRSPPA